MAQRAGSAQNNIRARPNPLVEFSDALLPPDRPLAPASTAFPHRNSAKTRRSGCCDLVERKDGFLSAMEFSGDKKTFDASRGRHAVGRWFSRYDKILVVIFLFSLPLSNPWVRGDGVGYYAFGRSLLIEHNLNFEKDWLAANASFRMSRTDPSGNILAEQFTSTDISIITSRLDRRFCGPPF